ncbi:hypothetical protein CAC42_2028 [Sphaceloma murrayae]|uniref:Uncharacterized protein n=1 Tax=Sphaceloma murrayae TaxID=2082308 RepID=A0A2K1QIS8_9PEZI|nr:hypothetical protein CAC42_2028 [Sphaceloma murrayae]
MAPELITAYAFGELLSARRLLQQFSDNNIAQADWTLTQAYYLSMGSVRLVSKDGYEIPICKCIQSGDGWDVPSCNPDLVDLIKMEKISLPRISDRDVQDRNKADIFTKLFTLGQSIWFIFNSLARAAGDLPLCPLEISSLAYVFCTAITYACWWNKPKDILTTSVIPDGIVVADLPEELRDRISSFDPLQDAPCHYRWQTLALPSTEAEILAIIRQRYSAIVGLVTGLAFCCIHLSAWNFEFATDAERTLWKTCSVASATIPLLSFLAVFLRSLSPKKFDSMWTIVLSVYCSIMLVYTFSRLILCFIMFTSLRRLPRGSFTSMNWALEMPHI